MITHSIKYNTISRTKSNTQSKYRCQNPRLNIIYTMKCANMHKNWIILQMFKMRKNVCMYICRMLYQNNIGHSFCHCNRLQSNQIFSQEKWIHLVKFIGFHKSKQHGNSEYFLSDKSTSLTRNNLRMSVVITQSGVCWGIPTAED